MSEFKLSELDYESRRKSANVVNVERPRGESPRLKTIPPTGNRAEKRSDRVGNTEGKRPEESLRESLG
ncbi:hypothetical protein, partial [Streptomyces glomeratus]|uniref:hypothetical protein n=1 Tax=Streptomyces glomeratus TaxID=284452 RepID=UPI0031DBCEE7